MKKTFFSLLLICLLLFSACSAGKMKTDVPAPPPPPQETPDTTATLICRVITAEDTALLLAKHGGERGEIYHLDLSALPAEAQIPDTLQSGQVVEITYSGLLQETYPARPADPRSITVNEYGFDDRCDLYLRVLEDLWKTDAGLNENVALIGVDLSATSLPGSEQSAIAWAFAARHNAEAVEGTLEYLTENGYISATPISATNSGTGLTDPRHYFYHWENGCHFSITEQPMEEGTYSLVPVTFDAQKWRSSLGAYFFCDCTSVQSALGEWSDYTIGSEMIS